MGRPRQAPGDPTQTQTSPSPYAVPKIIWSAVEQYFIDKYNVEVVEEFPQERVSKPTITWRILRRTPGGGSNGVANASGPNYRRTIRKSNDGNIYESYEQIFRVVYEYAIFGTSTAEVEDIAWDFESMVLSAIVALKTQIIGSNIRFIEQYGDHNYDWKHQDELMVRVLRYEAEIPIRRIVTQKQLDYIQVNAWVGVIPTNNTFTRTSTNAAFYIPCEGNQKVTQILRVYRFVGGDPSHLIPLRKDVDYCLKHDDNGILYMEWLDSVGATPALNEKFEVDFTLSQLSEIHNTKE